VSDFRASEDLPHGTEQAQVVPARSGAAFWPVLAAVLGVACVVLTFFLLRWAPMGAQELGSTADSSVEGACTLLEQVDFEGLEVDLENEEFSVQYYRLQAVNSLAMLAWIQDPAYAHLRETMVMPVVGRGGDPAMTTSEFVEATEQFKAACSDLTG
jgi:hypothetical protein